jgi:hypothetical protein
MKAALAPMAKAFTSAPRRIRHQENFYLPLAAATASKAPRWSPGIVIEVATAMVGDDHSVSAGVALSQRPHPS